MPELPEVETIKKGLLKTVLGKTIEDIEIRLPKLVSLGPGTLSNLRRPRKESASVFKRLARGQKIIDVRRRAKLILVDLAGPFTLLMHLKLTGQLIFAKEGEKKEVKIYNAEQAPKAVLPHKYTHVIFKFTDGSRLYFNDLRQFGYIKLVRDEEVSKVKELAEFGPEPFSKEFSLAYLISKAQRRPSLTIKQFLMDPQVVAGIGNIYSDEILYWAKIRPTRRLRSLHQPDWKAIYQNIPKVLHKAILSQGSSVGDFFKIDGSEGKYGLEHMVYQRYGEECKECGEKIEKVKLGGRTSSYCPACQK